MLTCRSRNWARDLRFRCRCCRQSQRHRFRCHRQSQRHRVPCYRQSQRHRFRCAHQTQTSRLSRSRHPIARLSFHPLPSIHPSRSRRPIARLSFHPLPSIHPSRSHRPMRAGRPSRFRPLWCFLRLKEIPPFPTDRPSSSYRQTHRLGSTFHLSRFRQIRHQIRLNCSMNMQPW
jgi:hypothetical protein